MRIILLEKTYTKCSGETISSSFLNSQSWAYLLIKSLKIYTICISCIPSWGLWKYIEIKLQITCYYLYKAFFFLKKRGLELVSLPRFLDYFWREIFFFIMFLEMTKFHCLVAFISWNMGQYVYCNCLFPIVNVCYLLNVFAKIFVIDLWPGPKNASVTNPRNIQAEKKHA